MSFGGLSLRDLEYVVEVARLGSFTAAARACAVSQPTLSAQVRKVEEQLGLVLFERAGRAVRVTQAGAAVLAQAGAVLGEARRLFELARGANDPLTGDMHLGAIATLGPYLVPHVLGPLRAAFPQMRLILREGLTDDLVHAVLAGDLDAVLLSPPVEDARIAVRPLFFEPFVLMYPAAADPSQGTADFDAARGLDDLEPAGLILMEEGHCLRAQALEACKAATSSDRHAASIETLRHLVAAGIGYSLLPTLAMGAAPALDGQLRYRALDRDDPGRTIALAWRRTDPRAPAFERLGTLIAGLDLPGTRPLRELGAGPHERGEATRGLPSR